MNPNVLVAAIAAGGSVVVAITALLLNYRGFDAIDKRFVSLEQRFEQRFASIERRLDLIEADLKEFFRLLARHETDITRLKDKTGLS
jgi:hypothetical protein